MSKLPEMPSAIVDGVYKDAMVTQRGFVREAGFDLIQRSPALALNRIISGLGISHKYGPYDAMAALRLGLFIPACFNRLDNGSSEIRVAAQTMEDVAKSHLPSDSDLLKIVADYSPSIAKAFMELFEAGQADGTDAKVLEESYRRGLRSFLLYERQVESSLPLQSGIDLGLKPDATKPALVCVRKAITSRMLLDIAIAPELFIKESSDQVKDQSMDLFDFSVSFAQVLGPGGLISALLTSRAVIEEYNLRGLKVPKVSDAAIQILMKSHRDSELRIKEDVNLSNLASQEMESHLDRAKKENPNLANALNLLVNVSHLPSVSVYSAFYHLYRIWGNQVSQDYFKEIIG